MKFTHHIGALNQPLSLDHSIKYNSNTINEEDLDDERLTV